MGIDPKWIGQRAEENDSVKSIRISSDCTNNIKVVEWSLIKFKGQRAKIMKEWGTPLLYLAEYENNEKFKQNIYIFI